MQKNSVSIIIVNCNGRGLIKTIIDSIKKSSFKNYEIIVVDNGSTDGSQASVRKNFKNIKLVENKKNLGYSGINSALKYCKGEYLLFLNNDMELDRNCIGNMLKAINSDESIAMIAPKLVNFYDKTLKSGGTWVSRAFYNGHIKGDDENIPKEIPYLGVGLIRKYFVDEFGYLFDPDYFIYAEDLDLGLRIRLNGKKAMFEPSAVIYHMHAVTTQKILKTKTTFLMERNLLATFFKILSFKNILLFLPYVLFARLGAIVKDLTIFKFNLAFSRIKAIFFVILNFGSIMEKRHQIQKLRKADDKYILKIFTEEYIFKKKIIV